MSSYALLDYMPDLPASEMQKAETLIFEPYKLDGYDYDSSVIVGGYKKNAILHDTYRLNAVEGATYDISSLSFFDPYLLTIYDQEGNAIVANLENDDFDIPVGGDMYMTDQIWGWRAPYTGEFYVSASWNQGNYYTFHALNIFEDIDTATGAVSRANIDRIFDWGEARHQDALPNDQSSTYYAGYYARFYDNSNAIGEQNGDIYFFNGQSNEIILVGNAHDMLNQVINDGF